MTLISEIELLRLWTAYRRIKDPIKRRQVLELIEGYAADGVRAASGDNRKAN